MRTALNRQRRWCVLSTLTLGVLHSHRSSISGTCGRDDSRAVCRCQLSRYTNCPPVRRACCVSAHDESHTEVALSSVCRIVCSARMYSVHATTGTRRDLRRRDGGLHCAAVLRAAAGLDYWLILYLQSRVGETVPQTVSFSKSQRGKGSSTSCQCEQDPKPAGAGAGAGGGVPGPWATPTGLL